MCVCMCVYVCVYVCICVYAYMYMYVCIIYGGNCPGGNVLPKTGGGGIVRGNCPGEVSGGIVRGGIVLHPYFQLQCRLSSRFILQMLFKILPGRYLSVMNLILLCNMNSS